MTNSERAQFLLGVEWGYKQGEKGKNIQATMLDAQKLIDETGIISPELFMSIMRKSLTIKNGEGR